jgi:hypothetical protein
MHRSDGPQVLVALRYSNMGRIRSTSAVFVAILAVLVSCSCSGGSGAPIRVAVSAPAQATDQGKTLSLTATVANDPSHSGVLWSLTGPGTLTGQTSTSVTYVAPAPSNNSTVQNATVTAASVKNPSETAALSVAVNPLPFITASTLPPANAGNSYTQVVSETGGSSPFTWSIVYGALPPGLNIGSSTGTISGTPANGGTWYFEVQLVDAAGVSSVQPFLSIEVDSNSAAGNPKPFLNQPVVPDAVSPGGAGFTLTVNGTGFLSSSTVNFNGAALPTTFVSRSLLTAAVPAADIATAATASITVVNPAPGGGSSNAVYFPVATPEANVTFTNASGSPITTIYGPIYAAVGDFTGQGKPDLAIAQFGTKVYVLLGNGDGTFNQASGSPMVIQQPPWDTLPTPYMNFITVGDFNNSGKLGLAVSNSTDSDVPILLGNGDGTFTPSSAFVYTAGEPVSSLAAGDFLGNGNLDLAVANGINGVLLNILLGYGDGAFNEATIPADGYVTNAYMPAVGDFNGDGKLDLAVTGPPLTALQDSVVTILLGNGDGTFNVASGSVLSTGAAPQAISVADLNGDGKLDLVIVNYQGNSVTIFLGDGNGSFTAAPGSPIAVGNAPYAVAVADFNGDGKLDLAVANNGDGTVTLLLGNGDGTFAPASSSPISVGTGPSSIAVGDFNGTGRLGMAVTNLQGNSVSILVQQP